MQAHWLKITTLWMTGVLAAAQLGKLSAIAPLLRDEFRLSLAAASFLVSLLEIGGASLGFVAGLLLGRFGAKTFLCGGLTILAITTILESLASNLPLLFLARAMEGFGYLMVVTAAPTSIAATAPDAAIRAKALALWSTFVPVGLGFGSALTAPVAAAAGARTGIFIWAPFCALGVILVSSFLKPRRIMRQMALPAAPAWLLTFSFGLYTFVICAFSVLLPPFLVAERATPIGLAGLVAGVVALAALPASFLVMFALRHATALRSLMRLGYSALMVAAFLLPVTFMALPPGAGALLLSGASAVAMVMLSGVTRTLIFTRVPALSGASSPDDPRIAATNGLLTQFGAGGALAGPPLGGLIVEHWSWSGLAATLVLLLLLMVPCLVGAEHLAAMRRCDR